MRMHILCDRKGLSVLYRQWVDLLIGRNGPHRPITNLPEIESFKIIIKAATGRFMYTSFKFLLTANFLNDVFTI